MIKGICALLVVCSHLGGHTDIPQLYLLFYGYIMLPSFFLVSGYLMKPKDSLWESLYTRVGKLLVLYIVFAYLGTFLNISLWKSALSNPMTLITAFLETTGNIIVGKTLWFVACLILIMIFLLVTIHITNNNFPVLIVVSIVTAALGYIFRLQGHMRPWSCDTAAVCQIFCVAGYVLKLRGQKLEERLNLGVSAVVMLLYLALVILLNITAEPETAGINVALNEWGFLPITVCMLLLGNLGIFALCRSVNKGIFLPYVGRHSLLYFVFASHFASVCAKILYLVSEKTGIAVLLNGYAAVPIITMGAGVLMAIACIFIDIFIPFLNGDFKMPGIKKKDL